MSKKPNPDGKDDFRNLNEIFDKLIFNDIDKGLYKKEFIKPNEFSDKFRLPSEPIQAPPNRVKPIKVKDRSIILSPLDEVFFDDGLMDELIVRTSVPQLLDAKAPDYPGVILFGPPGTGKSEFQKALKRVYDNAGAYAKEVSAAATNSSYVGQFAKNLDSELRIAAEQGESRGLPSLLSFDEGSILAQKAASGASSVSKHYQEAVDTMKRYLGNDAGKYLVLAISTNLLPEDFEDAMTREGRLTSIFIGMPSEEQIARMWYHFTKKNNLLDLTPEQAAELSSLNPEISGAVISKICGTYHSAMRNSLLKAKGQRRLIDALKTGNDISEDEVRRSVTYDRFKSDFQNYVERINERKEKSNSNGNGIPKMGFHIRD